MSVHDIAQDLRAEHEALDAVVAPLDADRWRLATPSPGWTVADQIGHLTYFDAAAVVAITEPERFLLERAELARRAASHDAGYDDLTLSAYRAMDAAELLVAWRAGRAALIEAATRLTDATRVEWYGPSMSSRSFLTARQMETWAHGQDVVDAAGGSRSATDCLRNIAQLGVITRGWSYQVRGRRVPDGDVRVELLAPSGAVWLWGPASGPDRIVGDAEDFCLVTTQRRHVDDTALSVVGPFAREWMSIAQAFAGGATSRPAASQAADL